MGSRKKRDRSPPRYEPTSAPPRKKIKRELEIEIDTDNDSECEDLSEASTEVAASRAHRDTPVVIYTDGSCLFNQHMDKSKVRAGYGAFFPTNPEMNISERFDHERPTNQRAELLATIKAIEKTRKHFPSRPIEIRTDSQYVVKTVNEWAPKWGSKIDRLENSDLIKRLVSLYDEPETRTLITHVKGHNGDEGNEMADALAREGASKPSKSK